MALVFLLGLVIFGGVGFFLLLRKQQSKEETA
jgi:preprotein translocase subunit YajC